MVELVKGKLLAGPILALIGSIMLLVAGLIGVGNPFITLLMAVIPSIVLAFVMPLILGIFGLLGAILAMIGKKYGNYLTLVIGLVAVVGTFIPVYTILFLSIPLVLTLAFIDPFLVLIGGIAGVAIKE